MAGAAVIFPHTVTVYPSGEEVDADGNVVRRLGVAGTDVAAYVQPAALGAATENLSDPQTAFADFRVWLDIAAPPLDAFAALDWQGSRYALTGEAQRFTGPDPSLDHWRASIRRH